MKRLKVKELIEALKTMPENSYVVMRDGEGTNGGTIGEVKLLPNVPIRLLDKETDKTCDLVCLYKTKATI